MLTSTSKRGIEYSTLIIAITLLLKLLCIGSNDLLAEEAYYWNYAMHLDFSYLDHPPMVAVLIKLFTSIFGINEFGVRIAAILCWLGTSFFSFKLTELIKAGAGRYAVMLLAILPFFFLHSLIITPDLPLIVCWSASIYYLYKAQVLEKTRAWYSAGLWLGLGLLSKYTIVLLGPSTLVFMMITPDARKWFLKKEPYFCLLMTMLLFTPVIYWNATHEWASFAFQSTRRFEEGFSFSFHQLLGLFVVFLTPVGVSGFFTLFRKNSRKHSLINTKTRRFIQVFTLIPIAVFSLFSLTHEIKFNWIGPSLLATIPWLAVLLLTTEQKRHHGWLITSAVLLCIYISMLFCIISGKPQPLNQKIFSKYIAWHELTQQVHAVAHDIESQMKQPPIIVPMDVYNIGSELAFYQAKFLKQGKIDKTYKIIGRNSFGYSSLMYQYWSEGETLTDKILLLISEEPGSFNQPGVSQRVIAQSAVKDIWSHSQGQGGKIRKYYYQVVQMK